MDRTGKILAVCLLMTATGSTQTVRSFDGDSGAGLAACQAAGGHCDRAEMSVAVNGKQAVQVTSLNFRVYDYRGKLLQSIPMINFIRNAGLNPIPAKGQAPIEPHIVYDQFIQRWIITVTGLNDCTLVSATSDATGSWGGVYISCLHGGPCLDYDASLHLGYDKNGVYICAAHSKDENPNTVPGVADDCFAVPPEEVQAIGQGKHPAHINRIHNMPLDILPAIDNNPSKTASAPALFASKSCAHNAPNACQNSKDYSFHWIVETFTWNGTGGRYNAGGEQLVKTDVGSRENKWFYNSPCCGEFMSTPQAGNDTITLRTATSHRLMNLMQSGTHLQGVLGTGPCTNSCGSQGSDTNNIMIWVDLDCSNPSACVVSQTAKISGSFNPVFGTVGVDAQGNTGIVAASVSGSTNLSLMLWTRRKTDPPNTFKGPVTIVSGTQPYTCLPSPRNLVPMGNSVGVLTVLDPADGKKLWTSQQWSNDATPCVWNTRIVEYQVR